MALPEKDWFELSEVAARWGCTESDLIHYGTLSWLEICVVVPDDIYGFKLFPECEYEHLKSPGSENPGFPKIIAMKVDDIRAIENRGKTNIDGGRYGATEMKWYKVEPFYFDQGRPVLTHVDSNDLRITRLARNKFEEHNKVGAFSDESPAMKSKSVSETKERNYQKIIGTLLELLEGKRIQPYTDSLIIDKLQDKYPNESGLSKSSLQKKFACARKVIKDMG
jgi:hypothetical protein